MRFYPQYAAAVARAIYVPVSTLLEILLMVVIVNVSDVVVIVEVSTLLEILPRTSTSCLNSKERKPVSTLLEILLSR